jgi:glutaminase
MSVLPPPFVSTGSLPALARVGDLVSDAHSRFLAVTDGQVSGVYPALATADPMAFGISVATTAGDLVTAGDCDARFAVMSAIKPFTFALVCEALGSDRARELLGVNATGLPFNSVEAIVPAQGGRTNPMVNPGAIATVSLVSGSDVGERWTALLDGLSAFAGRRLDVLGDVYESASDTNHQNRRLVSALAELDAVFCEPDEALDLYTRQCALGVCASDLAVMGATLADGGVNPLTGVRVVSAEASRRTLAVMATAGLYETSGAWLYEVGLPGKSGIGGGIVTVSPGKGGLGTYSPPLDEAGNSVRGQLVAAHLSSRVGLDLFASEPLV